MPSLLRTASVLRALCALVALIVLAGASPAAAQGKFKWWQSDRYKTELMLTAEQSKRCEEIFQHALPKLRAQMKTLESAEAELERLFQRGDDGAVMAQVARVEAARAELNTSRTNMLLNMRRLLAYAARVARGELRR